MSLTRFLRSLLAEGRVTVAKVVAANGTLSVPTSEELKEATLVLTDFESRYRDELPGNPPRLSIPSMLWGALTVFRTASFLTYRDVGSEIITAVLAEVCPEPQTAEVSYSVDLTLRFLPDLVRLARAASSDDPLVERLKSLGRQWPLSSVGILDLGQLDELAFLDDRCLKQLYLDRILVTNDASRLHHPLIAEAAQAAIGIHHQLALGAIETVQSLRQN